MLREKTPQSVLLEARNAGHINLIYLTERHSPLRLERIQRNSLPVLIVIGDDDESPTGPGGWIGVSQIVNWARGCIIHGAAAEQRHYQLAVVAANLSRRLLFVETSSFKVASWLNRFNHLTPLCILPASGSHPSRE